MQEIDLDFRRRNRIPKWTFLVKAFKSQRISDRQTDRRNQTHSHAAFAGGNIFEYPIGIISGCIHVVGQGQDMDITVSKY